jgi:hypothetical protein
VPEHLRSRVVGMMTSAGMMAAPFGGLVAGFFVGAVGLPTTLLVTGGVYLAVTLWPVISPSWREMDPGSPASSAPQAAQRPVAGDAHSSLVASGPP